jgi:hypothetical protein
MWALRRVFFLRRTLALPELISGNVPVTAPRQPPRGFFCGALSMFDNLEVKVLYSS